MKRFLSALLGIALLGVGCTKETSLENNIDRNYYVRFSVDGEAREYTENVLALRSNDNGLQRVTVQGLADLSANPAGLALLVAQPDPIVAQTYPEVLGSESPAMLLRETTGVEYTNLFMTTASGIEIVINDINTATIRGTFKGTVADLNGEEKEITEGTFYAPFK